MAESKKHDVRIWDLILTLLGMAVASAVIALISNEVLARHFLNLAFPTILGMELYRFFGKDEKFWKGLAGLAAYMIFRILIIVILLHGKLSTFPDLIIAWYSGQPIQFLPGTIMVSAWDFGFILIALAYFAGWVKDGLGKIAVIWTAVFLLFGIPLLAVLQWLFPATSANVSASFMDPANRDAFAQNVLSKLSHPWIWVLLLLIGITIVVGVKTKKWGGVLTLVFLVTLVAVVIYLLLGFTSHFQTSRWPWETTAKTILLPTTALGEGWNAVPLPANMLVRSGIAATETVTEIRVSGVVYTRNGKMLDADGWEGKKNSPMAILPSANLYQVIATLDPETKEGWFPVGTNFRGEIPVGSAPNFRLNAKSMLLSSLNGEFSVQIK